jgi:hypothetical protein
VHRRLRLIVRNARFEDQACEILGTPPPTSGVGRAAVDRIADTQGLKMPIQNVTSRVIVTEAAESLDLKTGYVLFMWQAFSGAAHGDQWALTSLTKQDPVDVTATPVQTMEITTDISDMCAWAKCVMLLVSEAQRFYDLRGTHH